MKCSIVFVLSVLVMILSCTAMRAEPLTISDRNVECDEILPLISELRSGKKPVRETTKQRILIFSERSKESRQCTIKKMADIVAVPITFSDRTLFLKHQELYLVWNEALDILATMKAIEALDVLVECLDCNDGKSGLGIGHFPAAMTVAKLGEAAIPGLERALTHERAEIRVMIAKVLREISGQRAKEVITHAEKTEKDPLVADTIRNLLLGWDAPRERP